MSKTFITTVIEDGDDLVLTFPDTLMEEMNWGLGDTLEWRLTADGAAVIRKIEDPTEVARAFEGINETSDTE